MTSITNRFRLRRFAIAAVPALVLALGACATPFRADVARFQQQLPVPQGQSFIVVADDPELAGGIEFGQYAGLVSQEMTRLGYRPAADPAQADMVVSFDYEVDKGRERIRSSGFDDFGFGGYYGRRPYFGRYAFGFYDPFVYGPGYNDVSSFTVYTSELELKIDRMSDNQRLFEGRAEAQSRSNRLQYLVPNLVEAMFTGFPGNSGETVRISIAPESR